MSFHFQFRRYRLPLRTVIRTAHEVWTERHGIIVRLEAERGRPGYGEIAPIPTFGTETMEQAEAACRTIGEWPTSEQLDGVPASLGCVRNALAAAQAERVGASDVAASHVAVPARGVASLLPTGRAAIGQLEPRAEAGFRVFKWKVGVADPADEQAILDELCAKLPSGGRLRLDANGAWDRRTAERWLALCAERPVEYVEQPCFAPHAQGETAVRRAEDVLLGLAHDYPTPIALDESIVGDGDVARWLGAGWPGWFIIKPTLLGDVAGTMARLSAAKANVVFSSALETAIGARAALRVAFAWRGEAKALGFGVWPLFQDPRFDGPAAAPFIRAEDVERLNPEELWNALG